MRRPLSLMLAAAAVLASPAVVSASEHVIDFPDHVNRVQAQQLLARADVRPISELPATSSFLVAATPREAARLRGRADVQRDRRRFVTAEPAEFAAYGAFLWHLRNPGPPSGTSGADINAVGAWAYGRGAGTVIAVIDTGADVTHPDLSARMWTNPAEIAGNGVDDDDNGYVDDVHGARTYGPKAQSGDIGDGAGHGTFVSGLAVGGADDTGAAVGVAPDAQVMAVKAIGDDGSGSDFAVAKAIHYALDHGAHVINLSLGGPQKDAKVLVAALARAEALSVPVIVSAGNEGSDIDRKPSYPASEPFSNIVSVAASDQFDRLAGFSNWGARNVDLAAPGARLMSAYPAALALTAEPYTVSSGTSASAPVVAGAAALLRQHAPSLGAAALRGVLLAGADTLDTLAGSSVSGARLDAAGAVAALPADRARPSRPRVRKPKVRGRKLTVRWTRPAGVRRFELVLDDRVIRRSRTSKATLRVHRGKHTLRVNAFDAAGNMRVSAARMIRAR